MENNIASPKLTIRLTKKEKSLRDLMVVLFRHKRPAAVVFIIILTAALSFIYSSDPEFKSESKILIQLGRENVAVDPSVTGPTISLHQMRENEVNSEISILTSRGIIEKVVDDIGPTRILDMEMDKDSGSSIARPFISSLKSLLRGILIHLGIRRDIPISDRAVEHIKDRFSAVPEKRSNVIFLSYADNKPQKSAMILNRLLETYLDHHIEVHKTQASPVFFKKQVAKLEQALALKEQTLKEFRAQYGIASVETQKAALQEQIEYIQTDRDKTAGLVDSTRARILSLQKELRGRNSVIEVSRITGRQNPVVEGIKSKLMDLRMQEIDLASRYPDDYRPLREIRGQIAASKELLRQELAGAAAEVTTGVDHIYQTLQIDLASARSELDSHQAMQRTLERALTDRKKELQTILNHELEEKELDREIILLQQEYIEYRNNLQRAVRDEQMDKNKVANVSIIQLPTLGNNSTKPVKALELLIAILMALTGGLLCSFIFESLNHSFKDGADVEKNIGVQVLATIPNQKE